MWVSHRSPTLSTQSPGISCIPVMSLSLPTSYTFLKPQELCGKHALADYCKSTRARTVQSGGVPMHVVIRIQGHLDQSWQQWLEDLVIAHESDGTSQLSGTLPNQAAL